MRFEMTNDELAVAIKDAHWLTRNTAHTEPTFKEVCDHLVKLLAVQQAKAGMVMIEGSNR